MVIICWKNKNLTKKKQTQALKNDGHECGHVGKFS